MALFSAHSQGDIWALSGMSFASPVSDILEKESFTLEELLEEDELIQEVKSKNDRLIQLLCTPETIEALLDYVIKPFEEPESDSGGAEEKKRWEIKAKGQAK